MAEILEDKTEADIDRSLDQQSFGVAQFEVFTHEYRENKEAPQCEDHSSHNGGCGNPSSSGEYKKRITNLSRRLQKALISLQRMPDSEVIKDMLDKMKEVNDRLNELLKQQQAEFSTKTVPLPEYDSTDMELFLGKEEVPPSKAPFEEVLELEKQEKEQLNSTLFEAETLLQEYEHIKHGIKA
ncbi:unnamed protein product [Cylicocyclus nassatus]|uniref:Uncharacterized protein n=1 Tax=Cylicocyclus nassatus TaxID=53992 RepID=A0AA36MG54_CYLNA|nr:unnamed protein product [Cylicocyclus nassatus]